MYKLGKRKFIYFTFFSTPLSLYGTTIWWGGGTSKLPVCRDRLFIFSMNVTEKFISRKTKAKVFIFNRNKISIGEKKWVG